MNGTSLLASVSWCSKLCKLLRAEIDFLIPGATVDTGFVLHTAAYTVQLHPAATALFLNLCYLLGLSERDATCLLRVLQSQLPRACLVSINIQS